MVSPQRSGAPGYTVGSVSSQSTSTPFGLQPAVALGKPSPSASHAADGQPLYAVPSQSASPAMAANEATRGVPDASAPVDSYTVRQPPRSAHVAMPSVIVPPSLPPHGPVEPGYTPES